MINNVVLIGRLTKDVEVKCIVGSGNTVSNFTIAVDRKYTQAGKEKEADFIPIVAWNKTAEFISKYFKKGNKIAIVGRLQTRAYDNAEGKKVYVLEVVAEEVSFVEKAAAQPKQTEQTTQEEEIQLKTDNELPF